jgi:predicted DNA-binding transcriptional regulator YafY
MRPRPASRPKGPRVGRPTGRFTQHRRIDLLREKLEAHAAGLTLQDLALMLRITTRSVRRYLRELGLVTEIESIPMRPGAAHVWRIKPSERGRAVSLRRTQAYALLAARSVFDVLKGSALFDEIDVLHREVRQVALRPAVRPGVRGEAPIDGRLEDRFAFVAPVARTYANRAEDVDELFRAVADLRVLRFRYRDETEAQTAGPSSKDAKGARFVVHPYALIIHAGALACVAHHPTGDGARVFAFERMSDVEASESERYDLPEEFAIADWLQGDFGVARAPRTVKLLVEFDARVAEAVRARRVHPSQKLAIAQDGRVRASLAVPDCVEVMDRVRAWLLAFGAAARVFEPRELADEMARELRRAAGRYAT